MKGPDGRVAIDGFEDDVAPPTAAERAALAEASLAEPLIAAQLGVTAFEGEASAPYYERLLFHPGLIINQLSAGRPGNQIPVTAEALLEVRLVTKQDPGKVYEAIRRHVARRMPEARLEMMEATPAGRMDPSEPVVVRAIGAASRAQGAGVLVYPSLGGTLPLLHDFEAAGYKYIGLPLVNYDNNQHVGNENLRVAVLPDGMDFIRRFLDALAAP
jgi:acetylornithine deacetylase/succinyl-diaminopimelate desuccinylase-like protein